MDGLSPTKIDGVHMNEIPTVEDLLTLNILLHDKVLWMGTLSVNLLNEVYRNTKILCDF